MAIEVEVLQHRPGEQAEAHRREAEQHRLERADPVAAARTRPRAASESRRGRRRLRRARRASRADPAAARACGTRRSPAGSSAAPARSTPSASRRGRRRARRSRPRSRDSAPRPARAAPATVAFTRPRTAIGYASATSEPCTGYVFDFATPAPKRPTKSANAFAAKPHANTITENTAVAQPMIGARRKRSASHPIGSAPRARNAPDAAVMKTMTPSLTWNVSRMFGASTDSVAFSSSPNALEQREHHEREHAAAHDALAQA